MIYTLQDLSHSISGFVDPPPRRYYNIYISLLLEFKKHSLVCMLCYIIYYVPLFMSVQPEVSHNA